MEMKQIHKLKTIRTFEFVKDQRTGRHTSVPVEQYVRDTTDRIVDGGETYEIHPDGTFTVPVALADFLTNQPDWHEGPNPVPPEDLDEVPKVERKPARKPRAAAKS